MRQRGKSWYSQRGHRWQYNTAHALCMLHNYGYRLSLRIYNTAFPRQVVMRTRLNLTLYLHYLSRLSYIHFLNSYSYYKSGLYIWFNIQHSAANPFSGLLAYYPVLHNMIL